MPTFILTLVQLSSTVLVESNLVWLSRHIKGWSTLTCCYM